MCLALRILDENFNSIIVYYDVDHTLKQFLGKEDYPTNALDLFPVILRVKLDRETREDDAFTEFEICKDRTVRIAVGSSY